MSRTVSNRSLRANSTNAHVWPISAVSNMLTVGPSLAHKTEDFTLNFGEVRRAQVISAERGGQLIWENEMLKKSFFLTVATGLLLLVASVNSAFANPKPLHYSGGPVLDHFRIHVLYWGQWTKAERDAEQNYLKNLAAYMSGKQAPDGKVPTISQYGVASVTLDEHQYTADTDESCGKPTGCGITHAGLAGPIGGPLLHSSVIWNAQHRRDDPLPGFGRYTLIVVLLPHRYFLTGCKSACSGAYHSSQSLTEFWAVIPEDQAQVVIGHEVQEASANPAVDHKLGWGETADPCGGTPFVTLTKLGGIQIPEIADNTRGGACNPTGYISKPSLIQPVCEAPSVWNPTMRRCVIRAPSTPPHG